MSNGNKDCTNCKYFHPHGPMRPFPGECRRFPPVQHSQDSNYTFVPVDTASWCGEHSPTGQP